MLVLTLTAKVEDTHKYSILPGPYGTFFSFERELANCGPYVSQIKFKCANIPQQINASINEFFTV